MTRDEAVQKVLQIQSSYPQSFVDALVALGLLKLDTVEEEIKQAAARKIAGSMIAIRSGPNNVAGYLDRNTAIELIGILINSGFKITR